MPRNPLYDVLKGDYAKPNGITENMLQKAYNSKPSCGDSKRWFCLFDVFRCGNKPSVLPRDIKTSGATTKTARQTPNRETLKREESPVYYCTICGLATVMSSYVFTAKLNLIADTFTLACKFRLSRINRNQIRKILKSYFLKKSVDFFETAEYNVKKGI